MNALRMDWSRTRQRAVVAALQQALRFRGRFPASPGGLWGGRAEAEASGLIRAVNHVFLADRPLSWAVCQWVGAEGVDSPLAGPNAAWTPLPWRWLQRLRTVLDVSAALDRSPVVDSAWSVDSSPSVAAAAGMLPAELDSFTTESDACVASWAMRAAQSQPNRWSAVYLQFDNSDDACDDVRLTQQSLIHLLELFSERWLVDIRIEQEKLAALKRLAYGASHEINNPLANIATRAQTLLLDETHPGRRLSLETINAQAFRGFEMLASLMHYAAAPPAQFEIVELVALTRRILVEFVRLFPGFSAEQLSLHLPDDPLEVEVDPVQIATMLHAILRNGYEATGGTGSLSVQLSVLPSDGERGTMVQWQIIDQGPPVDPRAVSTFCDPFHSGREAGRGLGFGLSKALRIVEAHRGCLELSPGQEQGLVVKVTLPVSQPPA